MVMLLTLSGWPQVVSVTRACPCLGRHPPGTNLVKPRFALRARQGSGVVAFRQWRCGAPACHDPPPRPLRRAADLAASPSFRTGSPLLCLEQTLYRPIVRGGAAERLPGER